METQECCLLGEQLSTSAVLCCCVPEQEEVKGQEGGHELDLVVCEQARWDLEAGAALL